MIGGKTKDEVWEDMDKKRAVSRRREIAGSVVWFTMVEMPTGWIRCGNAYSSKEEAEDWLHFVSESRGGRPAKVEKLKLNFIDGMLDEETIRTLDEKFNLDAPNS